MTVLSLHEQAPFAAIGTPGVEVDVWRPTPFSADMRDAGDKLQRSSELQTHLLCAGINSTARSKAGKFSVKPCFCDSPVPLYRDG